MRELREAIEKQAIGIGTDIVRVDMFLNHQLDTALMRKIGEALHQAFGQDTVDVILTAESSGIVVAYSTAQAFGDIPVVVAKKGKASTLAKADVYQSRVYSYTHRKENTVYVNRAYLPQGARVLIIDDFLANGEAAHGLVDIVKQAGAQVVGVGVCIEKGFQTGGATLRGEGYKVVALATVTGIRDGKPVLAAE